MFFIKQVLPIVLLSMVIGFAVAWFNWRSENNAQQQAEVETTVVAETGSAEKPVQQDDTTEQVIEYKLAVVSKGAVASKPVIEERIASAPVAKPSSDYVNDLESEFAIVQPAQQQTVKTPVLVTTVQQPPVSGQSTPDDWSAEHFLDVLNTKKPIESPNQSIAAVINQAAKRSEQQVRTDPYLKELSSEASDLSVSAVPIEGDMVRNSVGLLVAGTSEFASVIDAGYWLHTAQPGESLSEIAERVYGDRSAYTHIYEANRDVLASPDQLSVGQQLRIPAR